ncbi:hypothetical protein [Streptomyces spectabilis]|uniref:Uncharacterized protein n=1 Tax=Streptomyces spectabilis TaxID=68270 RepID=A0A7W8EZW3_STRST|nr:hypothetical protein [Streptomyces spectabilis]MBB5109180.1 hypothetical protein [Streptomyces spectabilis]MCI3907737.1 hypothetical protein [Streptomyces spectabilis]GGV51239.1 hypothetical protein GCM10010245_80710 [Streptomyces spectabilis]
MPNQPTPIRGTFTPDAPAPPKPNFLLQLGLGSLFAAALVLNAQAHPDRQANHAPPSKPAHTAPAHPAAPDTP